MHKVAHNAAGRNSRLKKKFQFYLKSKIYMNEKINAWEK